MTSTTGTWTGTPDGPTADAGSDPDVRDDVRTLQHDGVVGHRGAFTTAWVDDLRADLDAEPASARARPDGAVGRGPNRYYVEMHPEALRGFVDRVDHPWVRSVCAAVLGPDHTVVELGFDVPLAGAVDPPWHRDVPMPEQTRRERRLTSPAFDVTAVDTREHMGSLRGGPTTQWEDGGDVEHGMFPPRSTFPRYEALAVRKLPQRGDMSARSALTVHRGTRTRSEDARPVLVLGVDAPGAGDDEHHDLAVTRASWDALPQRVRDHLRCPVVDRLVPITQKHTIEGLVMGEA